MNVKCSECGKTCEQLRDGRLHRHRSGPGVFCPAGVSREEAVALHAEAAATKKDRQVFHAKHKAACKKCPVHNKKLVRKQTQYGGRYSCPEIGCTVVRWSGSTSTPADEQTRAARMMAHAAFDGLYEDEIPGSKSRAYKALAEFMGVGKHECHIGMFNVEQCERVVEFASAYVIPQAT